MSRPRTLLLLLAAPLLLAQEEPSVGRPYWVSAPREAGTALHLATAAVASGDWNRAAQSLQTILDKFPGSFAKTGRQGSYVGARKRALDLFATMPREVREEYERLFGPGAGRALQEALDSSDSGGLLAIVSRYEPSLAGMRAVLALADIELLRGRPAEARLLLARVRRLHPATAKTPAFLRRLAVAAARDHALGGPAPRGEETTVAVPSVNRLDDHAWPMLGGDATRRRLANAPGFHAVRYQFETGLRPRMYDNQPPRPSNYHMRRGRNYRADWEENWRDFNPVQPVLARGFLVWSNGQQVEAVNLYTGVEHWRYPTEVDLDNGGRTNLSTIFSPVVADGVVYAAIETPVDYRPQRLQSVPITYYLPSRRLVAIDLETARVLWSHEDRALTGHPDGAKLRELTVIGAPLVRGDRLYVGATRSEGAFHNRVVAFDRFTGRLIFDTRISYGQQELNLFGRQLQEAAGTPVAEADGVLYYGTNQGVFAAIDAVLGTPLWATTYPVVDIPSTYLWFEAPRRWPRFANAPPLVTDDFVITAPSDSTRLLVLHRSSGRIAWSKSFVGDSEFGFVPRVLQGADNERIYVSGESGVAALRLRASGKRPAGSIAWLQRLPDNGGQGGGRGMLAQDGLWIPTYSSVHRYDAKTGKLLASHERVGPDAERNVHLIAGDGVIVTAGRDFLSARYDENEVIRLAEARVRAHPDSVTPILGAADIYLATGRVSLSIERYRKARRFAQAHGIPAAKRRSLQGLHRALLTRAGATLDREPLRAQQEFEAAFRAAPDEAAGCRARRLLDDLLRKRDISELTDWRLRNLREIERRHGERAFDGSGRTVRGWALREMARLLVSQKRIKQALHVLQKLVESDPDGPDGRHASSELRAILKREGRRHYAPYERRARRLFEAALSSGDLEALGRALLIYANAEAAADATLELARRRLEAGNPTSAAHALQRFLVDRPGADRVPQALLLMVRALHLRGSFGPAYSALKRLQRLHSDARVRRADGAVVPAGEVAAEWLRRKPYPAVAKSARRRDLQPNLVLRFKKTFRNGSFIDLPNLLGQRPRALREAVLLKMGRTLIVLDSRSGDELYRVTFDDDDALGPIVLVDGKLLAVTAQRVYAFDATNGRILAREPIPGRGKGLALLEHRGQVFLLFRRRGMRGSVGVAALHPGDVTPIWTALIETEGPQERVAPRFTLGDGDRLLVFSERPARLTVVDSTSGAVENRFPIGKAPRSRFAVAPQLLPDGRVLVGLLTKQRTEGFAWQSSYTVHLLDPSQRGDRVAVWPPFSPPRDGENRYLRMLGVVGRQVVALDYALGAAVLDLRRGELVKWMPRLPIGTARDQPLQLTANQPRHDSLLLVTTRARRGEAARLSAFELPSLRRKYSVPVTDSGQETADVIETEGVLGLILMPNAQQRTRSRIRLYDPLTARLLQEIVPGDRDVGWFTAKVQNGILVVSPAGHAAYGYGPK